MLPNQTLNGFCLFTVSIYFSPKEYNLQKGNRNGWLFDSRRPREKQSPLRGFTFSESDIGPGHSYSFRSPSGRQQGSVRGKDDAAIARAFSCSSVYLQRGSDSWGGSSVCFPGVSSSSGTSDLLFLHPVCLLGDRQMRTVPCALGL